MCDVPIPLYALGPIVTDVEGPAASSSWAAYAAARVGAPPVYMPHLMGRVTGGLGVFR